jgi:hypothetical protein
MIEMQEKELFCLAKSDVDHIYGGMYCTLTSPHTITYSIDTDLSCIATIAYPDIPEPCIHTSGYDAVMLHIPDHVSSDIYIAYIQSLAPYTHRKTCRVPYGMKTALEGIEYCRLIMLYGLGVPKMLAVGQYVII